MSKFYITTPIYYVNDRPHIGHAYTTIIADVLARYHRMLGDDVYFLTGTDENSQKNVEAAAKTGEDLYDYVDRMSAVWQITWDELGISNNDFIRTTEERHRRVVEKFWKKVSESGDIYKGTYSGHYCVGCEAFYTTSDLIDGKCPIHQRPAEIVEEENYFFRLSNYRESLLNHITSNPEFIKPLTRRHEVINYIRDFMTDISISRPAKGWGISVPDDEDQVIYVWFDALINYLSAVGYGRDEAQFNKWWPADLHVMAKDIIKFHGALWPAMLMSAGLPLPKHVFAHGFFTLNGQKISKSLGNVIDPKDLVETYGLDALRYFFMREIPFGGDGDFSIERISARYDADLASGLGNFVQRVITLAHGENNLNQCNDDLRSEAESAVSGAKKALDNIEPHIALEHLSNLLKRGDQYIDEREPWKLVKDPARHDECVIVLSNLVETLRQIAWLLVPLMPTTAAKIFIALGWPEEEKRNFAEAIKWGNQTYAPVVQKIAPLFPRVGK